jgi:hypothetical protein
MQALSQLSYSPIQTKSEMLDPVAAIVNSEYSEQRNYYNARSLINTSLAYQACPSVI